MDVAGPDDLGLVSTDVEAEQTRKYSGAVGNSLPRDVITELHSYFLDARPHKSYEAHAEVRFIYEIIHKDGWRDRAKRLVDLWLEDQTNIERAAAHVGRRHEGGQSLLRGYCVFKLKEFDDGGWTDTMDSLGIDQNEPQTVVFIALEDLNATNGFFMALEQGRDVCLDSRAKIRFPSSGKGMGIFLALDL